jgi:hypothetical protein
MEKSATCPSSMKKNIDEKRNDESDYDYSDDRIIALGTLEFQAEESLSVNRLYLPSPSLISALLENFQDEPLLNDLYPVLELISQIDGLTSDEKTLEILDVASNILLTLDMPGLLQSLGIDRTMKKGYTEYDDYFNVSRIEEFPISIQILAIVLIYQNLLIDAKSGHSLSPIEWANIKMSFQEFVELVKSIINKE